ncbi:MAG: formylmethanofuran dehydrogenase subunit A [Planctomycetes bacterium]|nr:formylmethanofuran dehydrogenase subunit A [Planctomycetota bacterium]
MTRSLRIAGGRVYDPANNIDGRVGDVLIADGKVVASLPVGTKPETIDATGCIVMPGAIDMHCHIGSQAVNYARALQTTQRDANAAARPEWFADGGASSSGIVPTPEQAGMAYAALGYTTAMEAAVGPIDAGFAHLQLEQTPNLDTGLLLLLANHELLVELLDRNDRAGAAAVVQHLLYMTGAYGIKVVNPAGLAAWRNDPAHHHVKTIDDRITGTSVTPRLILDLLTQTADDLKLPHATHVHGNRLGEPGNYRTLIETLEAMEGRRVHVAHLQFYGYGATPKGRFSSAAAELCAFLAGREDVSADVGMVMFGPAVNITADTPLEQSLWRQTGTASRPAVFSENDLEAGCGVMPSRYSRRNPIHSLQWAIGLELALHTGDLRRLALTIDQPNGGSFLNFPRIIALLMNKAVRDEELARAHPYATKQSRLKSITRELTLGEIALMTRVAPARILGLKQKGHLGAGADGDVTVYADLTSDPERMFSAPRQVVKGGRVVAKDGRAGDAVTGTRYRARVEPSERGEKLLRDWFGRRGGYGLQHLGLTAGERARLQSIG